MTIKGKYLLTQCMIGTDTVKQRVYTTLIVSGANRIVFNSLKLKASLKINILPQFARGSISP